MDSCSNGVLPWPECLGNFDEESCRFFLRELGTRIVQFYPFSVGMEEVYAQIVDTYGVEDAPDAMSVLQELLEDDSTAAGIGDDGDIWRSWRHSWRHRNDNPHNPYVPRARGRLLPPATSTRIRLLKTSNFASLQTAQVRSRALSENWSASSSATQLPPLQEHAEPISRSAGKRTYDIDPRAEEYHMSSTEQAFNRVSSIGDEKDSPYAPSNRQLEGGDELLASRSYISRLRQASPRRSMPAPARKRSFPFGLLSPRKRESSDLGHRLGAETEKVGPLHIESIHGDEIGNTVDTFPARSPHSRSTVISPARTTSEAVEKTPLSVRFLDGHDNRYSLPSDFGTTEPDGTPTKKRTAHREARMIDGALFQGRSRKGKFIEVDATQPPVKAVAEVTGLSTHAQSVQRPPRASWLRNVLTRFHGEHNTKPKQPKQLKLRKQRSSLVSCTTGNSHLTKHNIPAPRDQANAHIPEMRQATPLMGFNGAYDQLTTKPLPLSPLDNSARPSIQSETQRAFFGREQGPAAASPSPSVVSSGITNIQQKSDLRSLVSATMSGPQELSPKERTLRYRFSNSLSQSLPPSPTLFTSHSNRSTHCGSDEPGSPNVPPLAPLTYHKQEISSAVWPFRGPHDGNGSEGVQVKALSPTTWTHVPQNHGFVAATAEDERRGRRPATPTSPSRSRFGLKASPPKTPRPRSRSPVKKLIGMVKSMSTNQICDEPTPPHTATSSSASKTRWKELSHKLRHGFLTPDLEQLDQEEMMEQYASNTEDNRDGVRVITPPSSLQKPTFPVSIKSSGQSKLWSELEYMLIETSNSFLKEELEHGRLSRDSIVRIKRQWQARNRPQVIEFYYDQTTQYDLIIANLRSIQLYSDYAQDAIMLNSVLHQWKILIRELAVKTLCMPDSVVRRWLQDGRRVLELLGALHITLSHLDRLTSLCFAVIGSAEKERAKTRPRAGTTDTRGPHRRSVSDGSQNTLFLHEQALLRGQSSPPPLPTPTSVTTASRKVNPQERAAVNAQSQKQGQAPTARSTQQAKQFLFSQGHGHPYGHGHSKSVGQAEERSRFMFD